MSDLARTFLGPLAATSFFADFFERQPYLVRRSERGAEFADVLSLDVFEFLVASLPHAAEAGFNIVSGLARRPSPSSLTHDGMLDQLHVLGEFAAGKTLLLTRLHTRWPPVGMIARSLERLFVENGMTLSREVGANAYLTRRGSTGFARHYDDHCAFILQVVGSKTWRFYGMPSPFPVEPFDSSRYPVAGPAELTIVLEPGDMLYVPRGLVHDASANDVESLHVTLGVYVANVRDLLLASIKVLANRVPTLRRALPPAPRGPSTSLADEIVGALRTMDSSVLEEASRNAAAHYWTNLRPIPGDLLAQSLRLDELKASTIVARSPGVLSRLTFEKDTITLTFPGVVRSGGESHRALLEFLHTNHTFVPSDIPGCLDDDSRVEVVRGLVADGVLRAIFAAPVAEHVTARATSRSTDSERA
jgi:hypothetical protein